MDLAKVFKKYTVLILLITLTAIIILLAMVPFVLPAGSLSFLPTFESVTQETAASGKIQCTSWSNVKMNGCTWEMFSKNPKDTNCVTSSREVELNLFAYGATSIKWAEVPITTSCLDTRVLTSLSSLKSMPYSNSKKITLSSTESGDKKVCVQFYGNAGEKSNICGSQIYYDPATQN